MQQLCGVNSHFSYFHPTLCFMAICKAMGEFPLIVLMFDETPWAKASSSSALQFGLRLCLSMLLS